MIEAAALTVPKPAEDEEEEKPNPRDIINIEPLVDAVMVYAPDVEILEAQGHSGQGFYAYSSEYPEDGSTFLGPDADNVASIAAVLANRLQKRIDETIARE